MIVGVGVDIVSVDRIKQAMENPKFVTKVLAESERKLEMSPEYVAGRWAAKEALVKCLGGVVSDYIIGALESGAPVVLVGIPNDMQAHISISHDDGRAIAFAVIESNC